MRDHEIGCGKCGACFAVELAEQLEKDLDTMELPQGDAEFIQLALESIRHLGRAFLLTAAAHQESMKARDGLREPPAIAAIEERVKDLLAFMRPTERLVMVMSMATTEFISFTGMLRQAELEYRAEHAKKEIN